jgi:hypothetical protein
MSNYAINDICLKDYTFNYIDNIRDPQVVLNLLLRQRNYLPATDMKINFYRHPKVRNKI